MRLRDYIDGLDAGGAAAYAKRCGISMSYLKLHIKYASKDPSVSLIRALAIQSLGRVTIVEVLEHYKILPTESEVAA